MAHGSESGSRSEVTAQGDGCVGGIVGFARKFVQGWLSGYHSLTVVARSSVARVEVVGGSADLALRVLRVSLFRGV